MEDVINKILDTLTNLCHKERVHYIKIVFDKKLEECVIEVFHEE